MKTTTFIAMTFLVLSYITCTNDALAETKISKNTLPKFSKVRQIVQHHFLSLLDYRANDFLTQGQVKPIFKDISLLGWRVLERRSILNHVTKDTDFLARELRTAKGKKVMRKISSTEGIYDLMHRMSWLRGGKKMVSQMIQLPDGADVLKTLSTSKRGKTILSGLQKQAPKGASIKKPTGLIYTEKQLIRRLKKSYDEEVTRRRKLVHN